MATKQPKISKLREKDPFDLDDDLNFPDDEFDIKEPKDDRKPVAKIVGTVKEATIDTFKDAGFLRKLLREAMPPVYGEVEDVSKEIVGGAKELYNSAVKEIKPSISALARATDKLIPETSKRTKSTLDRLKKWSSDEDRKYTSEDSEDIKEKNIAISLADIFKFQTQESIKKDTEDKAESKVQESLNIIRHRDQQSLFSGMNNNLSRLAQYQERITAAYQKKSLELQYRSYFTLSESLKESKSSNEIQKANLELIAKNTALPEFVKLRNSERIKEFARDKIAESIFTNTKKFIGDTFKNTLAKGKETISNVKDAIETGTMMAEMSSDMKEMSEFSGNGSSTKELIAKFGISKVLEFLALKAAGKVREKFDKNEKVSNLAKDTKYFLDNLPNKTTQFANGDSYSDNFLVQTSRNALASVLPGSMPDLSLQTDNSVNGLKASMFTEHTNKSIIEIIPGYLARIFRELQVMRTGDESIDLTKYDIETNSFSSAKLIRNRLLNKVVSDSSKRGHTARTEQVMNLVDPNKTLSKEEREALINKLIEDMVQNGDKSPEALSNSNTFRSNDKTSPFAQKLADLFKSFYTDDGKDNNYNSTNFKTKRNRLDSRIIELRDSFVNPAQELQKQINFGNYETVRDTGLMSDENNNIIDYKKLINEYNKTDKPLNDESASENTFGLPINKFNKENKSLLETIKNLVVKNIDNATITASSVEFKDNKSNKLNEKLSNSDSSEKSKITQDIIKENIKDSKLEKIVNTVLDNSNILKDFLKASPIGNTEIFTKIITDHSNDIKNMHKEIDINYLDPIKIATTNSSETLIRIEDYLVNKLKVYTSTDGERRSSSDKNDGFFDNVKKTLSATTKLAASTLKGILDLTKPGMKLLKGATDIGRTALGKGFQGAKIGTRYLADKLIKVRDIYVDGETTPRLTKIGINAGKYKDSLSGLVIRTIDDLKKVTGDIIDENGDIVLKHLEISKTFVKRIDGTGLIEIGKSMITGGYNLVSKGIGAPIKVFQYAKDKLKSFLDRPVDVYVKGSNTPVLLAVIMSAGGYISKTTGRVITKMSEIDGPVLDLEGNYVLSLEQLKLGLVDKFGKPIVGPWSKLIRATIGLTALGIKTLINAGSKIAKGVFKTFDKATEYGSGLLTGLMETINLGLGGKKSLDVLIQVRDILDSRLPQSKKKIAGDHDNDGDRDGSWKDLGTGSKKFKELAQRTKNNDKPKEDKTEKKSSTGLIESLINGIISLKDTIVSVAGLIAGGKMLAAGRGIGAAGDLAGKVARGGKLGKIAGIASKGGSIALKGLGLAGAAYGTYSAVDNFSKGNYGEAALDAGMAGLGVATTFGGLAGATAFGSSLLTGAAAVGGTLIAGTGAILSSPFLLGAAAVAAAGYGGYKLYKWLSSPNMEPLSKMRMGQYGFTSDDEDQIKKVQAFEKLMLEYVKYDDKGKASFIDKDLELKEILGFFDIPLDTDSPKDEKDRQNWLTWFKYRFKPVFLNSLTALKTVSEKSDLLSVDKLDPDIKLKYLKIARFEDGPYDYLVSPFPELKGLGGGARLVGFFYNEALKKITEENDKFSKNKKSDSKNQDKDSLGTAGIAAAATTATTAGNSKAKELSMVDSIGKNITDLFSNSNLNKLKNIGALGAIAAGSISAMKIAGEALGSYIGYNVQALEAVRFKAYGLKEMDRSKVLGLRKLEENMNAGITFSSNGAAVWSGQALDIFYKSCGDFGLTADTSDDIKLWNEWFINRFMPVYTKYLSLLKQITDKDKQELAEKALPVEGALDIANQIAGISNIWSRLTSPWKDYELNTDSSSTKENVQVLADKAKDKKLAEEKAQTEDQKAKAASLAKKEKGLLKLNEQAKKPIEPEKAPTPATTVVPANNGSEKTTTKDNTPKQNTGPVDKNSGASNSYFVDKNGNKKALPGFGKIDQQANNTPTSINSMPTTNGGAVGAVNAAVTGNDAASNLNPNKKNGKTKFNGFGKEVDDYIKEASKKYDIPEDTLRGFVKMEGGWTGKMSPTGAIGTGQFIQSTWNSLANTKEGKEIGMIPIDRTNFRKENDPRYDKRINTLATGLLAKQNADLLKKKGVEPTGENLYMVHNIGPGVIPAMKGEPVNAATITAMNQNGMKSGMTPADFVAYQKNNFNKHLAIANGEDIKPAVKLDDYADKSKLPKNTTESSETIVAQKTPSEGMIKASLKSDYSNQITRDNPSPVRDGYAGSINATRPDNLKEQKANNALRNAITSNPDINGYNFKQTRRELPQETNREIRIAIDASADTLKQSLDIQTQILGALTDISGKIDPKAFASIVSSLIPKDQGQAPAPVDPLKPNPYKNSINDKTQTSNVPVPMRRSFV